MLVSDSPTTFMSMSVSVPLQLVELQMKLLARGSSSLPGGRWEQEWGRRAAVRPAQSGGLRSMALLDAFQPEPVASFIF